MSTGYAFAQSSQEKRFLSYCKKKKQKKNIKKNTWLMEFIRKKIIYKISPAWNTA